MPVSFGGTGSEVVEWLTGAQQEEGQTTPRWKYPPGDSRCFASGAPESSFYTELVKIWFLNLRNYFSLTPNRSASDSVCPRWRPVSLFWRRSASHAFSGAVGTWLLPIG